MPIGGIDTEEANQFQFVERASDPTQVTDRGILYVKDVSGTTELFFIDDAGAVSQLTSGGVSPTQFWDRTGSLLSPVNVGDSLSINGNFSLIDDRFLYLNTAQTAYLNYSSGAGKLFVITPAAIDLQFAPGSGGNVEITTAGAGGLVVSGGTTQFQSPLNALNSLDMFGTDITMRDNAQIFLNTAETAFIQFNSGGSDIIINNPVDDIQLISGDNIVLNPTVLVDVQGDLSSTGLIAATTGMDLPADAPFDFNSGGTARTLMWNTANSRFQFNNHLFTSGTITAGFGITALEMASGAKFDMSFELGTAHTVTWDNTNFWFEFSHKLKADGLRSSDGLELLANDSIDFNTAGAAKTMLYNSSLARLEINEVLYTNSGIIIDGDQLFLDGSQSIELNNGGVTKTFQYNVGNAQFELNDSAEIQGDLEFGTTGKGLAYGSMYNNNTTTTVTIGTTSTFIRIPSGFTAGALNRATFGNAREITVVEAGDYSIDWSISMDTASNNQETEGAVMINNVMDPQATAHRFVTIGADTGNMGATCILSLSANDVIALGVANNTTATNIIIEHANMSVVKVGG